MDDAINMILQYINQVIPAISASECYYHFSRLMVKHYDKNIFDIPDSGTKPKVGYIRKPESLTPHNKFYLTIKRIDR